MVCLRLPDGKIIYTKNGRYNYGSDKTIAITEDLKNIKVESSVEFKKWVITNGRSTLSEIISYEPQGVIFFPSLSDPAEKNGWHIFLAFHLGLKAFFNFLTNKGGIYSDYDTSLLNQRANDMLKLVSSSYPFTVMCLILK